MPQVTETEIRELRELVLSLREEMRVGFAQVDTKFSEIKNEIQRVEAKTDTKFAELKSELKGEIQRVETKTDLQLSEIKGQINVIEERTKLGFWGFVGRSIIITLLGLLSGFAVKYFFFGTVKI
jgi:uncharacterized protein Yka (UPF0111/DUF47 family)